MTAVPTGRDPQSLTDLVSALTRLLAAASEAGGGPATVERTLLQEARRFFRCGVATLLRFDEDGVREVACEPEGAPAESRSRALLALPLRVRSSPLEVLVLADDEATEPADGYLEVATAFKHAAEASLVQLRLAEELAASAAQHAALARAARLLNESLDLTRVLPRICREAAAILDADVALVWRGDPVEGVTVEAAHGFAPEIVGYRLEPGEGVAGRVALEGKSLLVNDYAHIAPPDSPFVEVQCVLGVPMRWTGEVHGVLAVGYLRERVGTDADLRLLETFAELAAIACRNASEHAGLAHAARTDGLTGCLNHAALHEALAREVERSKRSGQPLSLVLLDLDDFKQVNERHGHLVGDEVLRRVGYALQQTLRPYDHVARYGGDEFAIVAVDASEEDAAEIAQRTLERLPAALGDFAGEWPARGSAAATAGVAQWSSPLGPTDLIAEADRALLFGKREEGPLRVVAASTLPASFRPGRFRRREDAVTVLRAAGSAWPQPGGHQLERLRRRMRQLAQANDLAVRLAAMTRSAEVIEATVEEIHRLLDCDLCAILRSREDGYVEVVALRGEVGAQRYSQPRSAGMIGRCLRERETIVSGDVTADPDYIATPETTGMRSEACVPIALGGAVWGVVDVESAERGAFDDDAVRLLQTIADLLASALSSALSHERLERRPGPSVEDAPPRPGA